jgi:hypothetical protein
MLEKAVTELKDDLFEELMAMMLPPGDLAWKGEEMGKFFDRIKENISNADS